MLFVLAKIIMLWNCFLTALSLFNVSEYAAKWTMTVSMYLMCKRIICYTLSCLFHQSTFDSPSLRHILKPDSTKKHYKYVFHVGTWQWNIAVQWVTDTLSRHRCWSGHLLSPQRDLACTFLLLAASEEDVTAWVTQVLVSIATPSFTTHP